MKENVNMFLSISSCKFRKYNASITIRGEDAEMNWDRGYNFAAGTSFTISLI